MSPPKRLRSSCHWCDGLARFLPQDVRVLDIGRARTGFRRTVLGAAPPYVYRLSTAPYGVEPQEGRYVTAWPRPLDVEAMSAASRDLLGLHDSPRSAAS